VNNGKRTLSSNSPAFNPALRTGGRGKGELRALAKDYFKICDWSSQYF
jgi:hypothetical protein